MSTPLRHQLPAYSPLSGGAVLAALARRVLHGADEVTQARSLVATLFSADDALIVDSGRSALRLAIEVALSPSTSRRVVALPAFQCYEVATAAVGVDVGIVQYDIDPASLQPDMESLERALRQGASAIVIAPLYGLPVNWDALVALTERHGAIAIEDAAQANGAEWHGRRLGALGAISVVSFGRGKGWTGGGGGALLLRGDAVGRHAALRTALSAFEMQRELRVVATALLQLLFGRQSLYGIPAAIPSLGLGETRYYEPTEPKHCSRFSAALLRQTLDAAALESVARREVASYWSKALPVALSSRAPSVLSGGVAGYLRYPLRLREDTVRRATDVDGRRAGIARSYPRPLGQLPAVAARLIEPDVAFPGADALARQLVTLPTHSRLSAKDREDIVRMSADWI